MQKSMAGGMRGIPIYFSIYFLQPSAVQWEFAANAFANPANTTSYFFLFIVLWQRSLCLLMRIKVSSIWVAFFLARSLACIQSFLLARLLVRLLLYSFPLSILLVVVVVVAKTSSAWAKATKCCAFFITVATAAAVAFHQRLCSIIMSFRALLEIFVIFSFV